MALDAIALLLLAVFMALGAWRGALASALGIGNLVAGYAVGLVAAARLGGRCAAALELPPLLGGPVAGTLAFTATLAVLGLVARVLVARQRRARGDDPRGAVDLWVGGLLGGLRGAFVVLLVGWLAVWTEALRETSPTATLPEVGPSRVSHLAARVVEAGASAVVDEGSASGRVTVQILAHPGATFAGLRSALQSPRVEALRDDAAFWNALERGDVDGALARGTFRSLAFDPAVRSDFARLGLVSPAAAESARAFDAEMVDVVKGVAPRLVGLRSDPELQRLLEDPEVQAALRAGDRWALLSHPGFQRLASRLAARS